MTTRMTINGVSTCAEAGTEKYERFAPFVLGALRLLAAGFAMRRRWFRQIP